MQCNIDNIISMVILDQTGRLELKVNRIQVNLGYRFKKYYITGTFQSTIHKFWPFFEGAFVAHLVTRSQHCSLDASANTMLKNYRKQIA